jgi:predicted ferric reductase
MSTPLPQVAAVPPRNRQRRFPDPRITSEVVLWMLVFFAVVALPVVVAMVPVPGATPKGVLRDFASALGYVGVAMIGALFVLTARFPRATAQFGIDVVFHFHRWFALLSLLVIGAHIAVVIVNDPNEIPSFNPLVARASHTAGGVALLLFVAIALWSLLRKRLAERPGPKLWFGEYDHWRIGHAVLATVAYALLVWHVFARAPSLGDGGWKRDVWAAYAALGFGLVFWVRFVRPTGRINRRWMVEELREEVPGVWTIRLKACSKRLLRFLPGQFVWLTMRSSRYAMREHPFSIASPAHPKGKDTIELTIRERGNFTDTIRTLERGEVVWIDGPYGRFTVAKRPKADIYLFVTGGIGIVPFMSMLRTAADNPAALGHKRYVLLNFTSKGRPVLFGSELVSLSQRMKGRLLVVHVETDGSRSGGYMTPQLVQHHVPDIATLCCECFLCGPVGLSAQAEQALQASGVPGSRIHQELFEWA